jgi:LysR family transcriptional regulator for metE and metH
MVLEVRHLLMLDAIRRSGGVSRAAERLHLTQPAVSHALRDLEDRLGTRIFERRARRMHPTPEGERLLRAADVVLDELRRAEDDITALRNGQQGVVRLATQCYTCYHWLPRVLATMGRDHPGIELRIVPEATRRPLEALLEESLDLAITHDLPDDPTIVSDLLFEDELVAILPPDHRFADRAYLEARDFAGEHVILHGTPADSTLFHRVLRPAGVEPRRTSQLMLTEALVEMVRAGLGISVLARWAVAGELDRGILAAVRVTRSGLQRQWYASVLKHRRSSPVISGLVALLQRDALVSACECGHGSAGRAAG